jgi:two-component system response regulator
VPPLSDVAVLVVDDNPDHRELTRLALCECCDPSRIATAGDGAQALDYLFGRGEHEGRDTRKQPRLAIVDMELSQLSGIEVLRAIRGHPATKALPVVMVSSSSDKSQLDGCYLAGANSVVRKSLDYEELRRKMRRVYEFWVTVNEANRNSRV